MDGFRRGLDAALGRLPPRVRHFVERFADRDVLLIGSSLGFYGLVSVMPLLLIAFAAVGAVFGTQALDQLGQQAPSRAAGELFGQLTTQASSLSPVTVLFAVWPATAYGGGLRRALQQMSDGDEAAPGLRGRLLGVVMVFVLPLVVALGIPVSYGLSGLTGDGAAATALGWALALVGATAVGTLLLSSLYQLFAPEGLGWRATTVGAALAAVVSSVVSLAFVVYLRYGASQDRFGGPVIGAVVLLGVWLFAANVVLLAGYTASLEIDER